MNVERGRKAMYPRDDIFMVCKMCLAVLAAVDLVAV
jgi:hypothetical protein